MKQLTPAELQAARAPIASLISKSQKAQQKLSPGTWQHQMLDKNLKALSIASALIEARSDTKTTCNAEELQEALTAIASMIDRTEKMDGKFTAGTSQHSLQKNRLKALKIAEMLVKAETQKRNI